MEPACSDPQNHSSTPDLIPGRRTTGSDRFQLNDVWREDRQHLGLASVGRIAPVNQPRSKLYFNTPRDADSPCARGKMDELIRIDVLIKIASLRSLRYNWNVLTSAQ